MRKFILSSLLLFAALPFAIAQVVTLGTYATTTIKAGGNAKITPATAPTNAPAITAYTSTNFKGQLRVVPTTGVLVVTNAYPAGTYTITVKGFGGFNTATTSFTLNVTNPPCSPGIFSTRQDVSTGTNLTAFAIGDFNQSGNQDFAATNANNVNNVSFRLGNGAGGFSSAANIPVGANPRSIAVSDFNGDGQLDFATGNSNNTVSIRLGFGANGFTTGADVAVGNAANSIATGDFNNDGRQDFATGNYNSNTVSIRFGDGAGGFTGTTDIPVGTNPTAIAIGDFNTDGNADFATANITSNTVSVRLGDGLGGFTGTTELNVQGFPISIEVADFNADGVQDIAVANSSFGSNSVSIQFGNGLGAFGNTTQVNVGASPRALTTGDFNGDGYLDIATANTGSNGATISVRYGNGTGNFSGNTELPLPANPGKLLTGDFNNDGRQDLAALSDNSNIISIRYGTDREINLRGNNTNIVNGDGTPSLADHTDFGNVGSTLTRNFTIQNTGTANLTINNITITGVDSALFTKGGLPLPMLVGAGRDTFFTITFSPNSNGLKTATIKILSDDCDEPVYDFSIQGMAIVPTLGNYPLSALAVAGSNTVVTPSAAPANAASITAYTSFNFKGLLQVNPATGAVSVTNAHPTGTYIVTVRAVYNNAIAIKTFTLQIGSTACSEGLLYSGTTVTGSTTGFTAYSIASGDFNNDGKADFAVADYDNAKVGIRLGDGSGGFTAAPFVSVGTQPLFVSIADFNNDGNQDLASVNQAGNSVSIRLGNGTGNFTGTVNIAVGNSPRAMAVADFNGDGNPDFAVTNYTDNTVSVFMGNGSGSFNFSTNLTGLQGPKAIILIDFNADGLKDLIVANYLGSTLSIFYGNGSGFASAVTLTTGTFPDALIAGDFTGDGKADYGYYSSGNNAYYIITSTANGGPASGIGYGTSNVTGALTGDFNNDGKTDFATIRNGLTPLVQFLGNGAGDFTQQSTFLVPTTPLAFALADVDNNGIQDLLLTVTNNVAINLGGSNDIKLSAYTVPIAANDSIPNTANSTDFGPVDSSFSRTFTITNASPFPLTVSSVSLSGLDASSFSIRGNSFPVTLPPNTNITFNLVFVPHAIGLKTAMVKINSNNCQTPEYRFAIQGTGVAYTTALAYPAAMLTTSGKTVSVLPTVPGTSGTPFTATTSPGFRGVLQVNPVSGAVNIINPYPAGTYTITVRAYTFKTSFVLTVTDPACSQGRFTGNLNEPVGSNPNAIAIGDFNGDGKPDFVTANFTSNNVSVRLGTGSGTFTAALNNTVGTNPYAIAVADFNRDGRQDIAVTNSAANTVSIRLGNGAGTFTAAANVTTGNGPRGIVTADFNGDGKTDIATANYNAASVSIRLGDGSGAFNLTGEVPVANLPNMLWVGDFNKDGHTDFAVSNSGTSNVISIRLGNGNGGFTAQADLPVASASSAIAGGDMNSDGNPDLLVAVSGSNTVVVFAGNGTGSFSLLTNVAVGGSPNYISVADFNGDGKPDFAVANSNNVPLSVWLGNGSGSFVSTSQSITSITAPAAIAVADFNGDGRHDLAVANGSANTISIRLGTDNEINLRGNNVDIADGNSIPDTARHTDFGTVANGGTLTRTFTIQNTGADTLKISAINLIGTDSLLFNVGGITLPANVLPGAAVTFTITFTSAGNGFKTARVSILSNDCDESVYDYAIKGTASCTPSATNNMWLGNTADWSSSTNWSLGFVPTECTKVVVNTGVPFMPEITSPTSVCYNLALNNGATITIKSGGHLNITANN